MATHKLLYVDDMKPDRMQGFVKDRAKIIYNMELIHPATAEKFKETIVEHRKASLVMIAGRYICIITMALVERELGMLIVNLDQNESGKQKIIKKFTNDALIERITTAFEAIKNTPESYYDFELEVGEIPVK